MQKLMTTDEVAKKYGLTRQRIHAIAKDRGVAGTLFGTTKVFTPAEVDRLKPGPNGRHRTRKEKRS